MIEALFFEIPLSGCNAGRGKWTTPRFCGRVVRSLSPRLTHSLQGAYLRHTGRCAHAVLHAPPPVSAEGRKGMTASTLPGWKLPCAPVSRYITAAPPLSAIRSRGTFRIVLPCLSRPVSRLPFFISRLRGIASRAASRFSLSPISPTRYSSRRIPALFERYGRGQAFGTESVSRSGRIPYAPSRAGFPFSSSRSQHPGIRLSGGLASRFTGMADR